MRSTITLTLAIFNREDGDQPMDVGRHGDNLFWEKTQLAMGHGALGHPNDGNAKIMVNSL